MSDVFSRLVARAWDTEARVRPQIAPRYAPRTASLPVEEIAVEREAPSAVESDPLDEARAVTARPTRSDTVLARETPEARPSVRSDERPAPAPRVDAEPPTRRDTSPLTLERTIERIFASSVERTHVVEAVAPVAAPPPQLRAADAAVLRPPEADRRPIEASVAGPRAPAGATATRAATQVPSESIHVSIGRIDVRATPAPAVATPHARPRQAPLALDDYLRRRNEGR
jgi:hypothetical protein